MLNLVRTGTTGRHPPLVIAHGLFGSARNWGAIAKRLATGRQVLAVDMRNHGLSFRSERHDYPAMAGDLAEVIDAEGGQADVLGHSMGGKAAMMLALTHPDAVRRLIVADIAPVPYTHSHEGHIEAMRALRLDGLRTRAQADEALAAHIDSPEIRSFLLQSLDLQADPPHWRINLEALARQMDKITGWPEVEGRFDGPLLFLSGAESDYLRDKHRPAIKALFPNARFAKLLGAGHWLHAEKPADFATTVRTFLDAGDER
ncbi:alpha/beta hydrolase [Rhodobacteraceae bacterium WD3A24]|nr:alpha/beta hydrolase [Rhodobacteraceae bacterium WD3A24]